MTEAPLERRTVAAGTRIFVEGDPGDCAYLVETGRIEISKKLDVDEMVLGVAGRGDMIGEMALLDNEPRMATARATEMSVLVVVPKENFERRLEKTDPVIRRVLMLILKRLRAKTTEAARKAPVIR